MKIKRGGWTHRIATVYERRDGDPRPTSFTLCGLFWRLVFSPAYALAHFLARLVFWPDMLPESRLKRWLSIAWGSMIVGVVLAAFVVAIIEEGWLILLKLLGIVGGLVIVVLVVGLVGGLLQSWWTSRGQVQETVKQLKNKVCLLVQTEVVGRES